MSWNIRINQLKRRISSNYSRLKDNKTKLIVDQILEDFDNDLFLHIYSHLQQINVASQIFSRAISQIATDEFTTETYYRIKFLKVFIELLIIAISQDPINYPLDLTQKITLSKDKFQKVQEEIRVIKKKRFKSLNTLEQLLLKVLEKIDEFYSDIIQLSSWQDLLSFIFEVDLSDKAKGAKKIKQVNIKEQLLSSEFSGSIIDDISKKYDGIITFCMSLLTMISSTEYSEEFNNKLNKILEKLGSSTQIFLLQSRLLKNSNREAEIKDVFTDIHNSISNFLKMSQINVESSKIIEIFNKMKYPNFDHIKIKFESIDITIPELHLILSKPELELYCEVLEKNWKIYTEIYDEIYSTLKDLNMFFNSIIKQSNDIIGKLISRHFQASIPLQDVNRCENAGIHLKSVIATSSTINTHVSDEIMGMKQKFLRKIEEDQRILDEILLKKSKEEEIGENIPEKLRIFTPLLILLHESKLKLISNYVHTASKEEVFLSNRILYTLINIIENIIMILEPIIKKPYNRENLEFYTPIISVIKQYIYKINIFNKFSILLSQISKRLWHLSRKYVLVIGQDPEYLLTPDKIQELIQNIPDVIKREYQQRLLTLDERRNKINIYYEVQELILKIEQYPIQERMWLLPCSEQEFGLCFDNS